MNIGKTLPFSQIRLSPILFLLLALLLSNCQGDPVQVPTKDEFTKEKRESLGQMINKDISSNFEILENNEPFDSLYWYVQALYNQSTRIMLLDKKSAIDNRWDTDREWKVSVINDDYSRHAFCLPGGDIFITTGMLKSFTREHELFFVFTFEATLMHEGRLLQRLIEEYNSLTINNLIEGRDTGNEITLTDMSTDLPNLIFDNNTVEFGDRNTVASICNTSILEPTGINTLLLDASFQNSEWLLTRPSYGGRPSKVSDFSNDNAGNCGSSTGKGNYQKFVLDVLNP